MTVKFFNLGVHDAAPPLLIEDTFRAMAGAADIQSVVFDSFYKPTIEGWTTDEGAILVVIPFAPRWDDGVGAWDDELSAWLDSTPADPTAKPFDWDTGIQTWGNNLCLWS